MTPATSNNWEVEKMAQEHRSPRHAELTDRGWTRQFSADRSRLDEAVEQYKELGLEVLLEPVDLSPGAGCTSCIAGDPDSVKVIYTRPR